MLLCSRIIVISDYRDGLEISQVVQMRSGKEKIRFKISPSMYMCVHACTHMRTHTPSLQKLGLYMAYILDYFTDLFK